MDRQRIKPFLTALSLILFSQRVIVEPSFAAVEDLLFGRLAFKGMNPEIEKMMDNDRIREEEAAAMRAEKSIDDQEMAAAYGNLNETMARKFGGKKRQHQQIAGGSSTSSAMMASTSSGVGNSKQLLSDVSSFLKSARSGGASVASEGTNPGELKRPKQEFLKPKDDF